jgi:sulfonate transport system ATP-binding protein
MITANLAAGQSRPYAARVMSTSPAPARVSLRDVERTFGTHTVLHEVDIEIEPGEVVALLGSSGSGKSTLLRLIAGLDRPTHGRIEIDGEAVRGIDPRCAMVFQEPRLLPWRSLAANVEFGLPPGTARTKGSASVQHWLDVVGLHEFGDHHPRQVSGGMAQRAGLARALVRQPRVLLLDEPLAALDALTRLRMQDLLDTVQQEAGTTTVLVTHDVDEAAILADRVLVLRADARPGRKGAAGIAATFDVEIPKPRDRGDPRITVLRDQLLDELGVPRRGSASLRSALDEEAKA